MLKSKLPFLTEPELLDKIEQQGIYKSFKAGDTIVEPGKHIKIVPLVVEGTVKIIRVDQNGNELFLYHLSKGQSCAFSFSSFLSERPSDIKAIAEDNTKLILIPKESALSWFHKYPSWCKFIMSTMENRFDELIQAVDNIAFTKTDERLLAFITKKAKALKTNTINITHQEIANELSSSREVVSRLLKQLEKDNKVKLGRNKIEIISLM